MILLLIAVNYESDLHYLYQLVIALELTQNYSFPQVGLIIDICTHVVIFTTKRDAK